jgi:hypothetical protein
LGTLRADESERVNSDKMRRLASVGSVKLSTGNIRTLGAIGEASHDQY